MKKTLCHDLFLVTAFFCATAIAVAAEMAPDTLVKQTSQDVLEIVKNDKDIQAGNKRKINALIDAKVLPHFDRRLFQGAQLELVFDYFPAKKAARLEPIMALRHE